MRENRTTQVAAVAAMAALVADAPIVRGGAPAPDAGGGDAAIHEAIEAGADHIAPAALADRLMRGEPILLVDLRPEEEFARYHLPGAVRMPVPELLGPRGAEALGPDRARAAVLYSNGPGHPGQAWVELARRGYANVRVLDGGLEAFKDEVLTPPSLRGPVSEARAREEGALFRARRAFFLAAGRPRPAGAGRHATDPVMLDGPAVVSPRWAHERLGRVALIDARERAADHRRVRLPGALHLPHEAVRGTTGGKPHLLLGPDELARRIGALGIEPGTEVVIYGDEKLQDVTLVALALLAGGHERVALLEGGILAWAAEGRPLEIDAPPPPAPAPREHSPRPAAFGFAVGADEVWAAVRARAATVLDVRPPEFFRGEKSTEARPGHIPGARNREYALDSVRAEAGHFWRPREELRAEYAKLLLEPDRPTIVSCRTGHQASASFFVLRFLLGHRDVRWYNGSWTEWAAREDLPAETGEPRP